MKLPVVNQTGATQVTDGLHRVTGDLTPDSTGDYLPGGIHNGEPYYVRGDSTYYIWWHVTGNWILSTGLDVLAPGHWYKLGHPTAGVYDPDGTYLGDATVTEI